MSHAMQGYPRQVIVRVLTKRGPPEEGMATHSSVLPQELHEEYEKAKRYDTRKWAPRSECVHYAAGEE